MTFLPPAPMTNIPPIYWRVVVVFCQCDKKLILVYSKKKRERLFFSFTKYIATVYDENRGFIYDMYLMIRRWAGRVVTF